MTELEQLAAQLKQLSKEQQQLRSKKLQARLTPSQDATLTVKAQEAGMTRTDYIVWKCELGA